MTVKFTVRGHQNVERVLLELGARTATRLGDNAVMAGARLLAREAKLRAPVDTGRLRKSIRATSDRRNTKSGEAVASVVTGVWYARLIEYGTSKMPARSFMRAAGDDAAHLVAQKVGENLGQGIEREATRLAKIG